jgi:LysR family transcriptional regulator, low CO2-responsive transcriptional regulator
MNIDQIRAFHKVASTGSFTRAARELFITQPAVSQEIKALEASLGIKLFDRSGKNVRMTAEGEVLLSYALRLFALHEEMESLFGRSKNLQHGQIKLGSTALMGTYFLPKIIGRFNRRYPGIEIDLQMGNSDQVMHLVLEGLVDLGFSGMTTNHTRLESILIHQEKLIMVASPRHPLSARKISLDDISDTPFIWREKGTQTRKLIEKWFLRQLRGHYPRKSIELQNMEAAKRMVEEGYGITVVPEAAVKREISAGWLKPLQIEGLNVLNSYYLVSLKSRKLTSAAEAFRKMLSKIHLFSLSENLRKTIQRQTSRGR